MKALSFIALLSLGFTCNEEKSGVAGTKADPNKLEVISTETENAEAASAEDSNEEPTYVYICVSAGAKKYHYKQNCRGLSGCRHEIRKIKLESAKENGKTLCGWEK